MIGRLMYKVQEKKRMGVWREVVWFYAVLLMVWGGYRLMFELPVWVEEVVLKAAVFGIPVWWMARKHKWNWSQLGITRDRFFQSVYLGLGLGVILGFLGQMGNIIRHGTLVFESFGLTSEELGGFMALALVTAFWEELVFMGYILQRLGKVVNKEQVRIAVVGLMFGLLHVPALIVQGMPLAQVGLAGILLVTLGAGNAVLMLRQKNLIAPIMAHALWGITVFMFR